jgi:hypothetical protein
MLPEEVVIIFLLLSTLRWCYSFYKEKNWKYFGTTLSRLGLAVVYTVINLTVNSLPSSALWVRIGIVVWCFDEISSFLLPLFLDRTTEFIHTRGRK